MSYIDVEWHEYPKEKPFAFPGKTLFYVTIKINSMIISKLDFWTDLNQKFDDDDAGVIAWAYIPHANAYILKEN